MKKKLMILNGYEKIIFLKYVLKKKKLDELNELILNNIIILFI